MIKVVAALKTCPNKSGAPSRRESSNPKCPKGESLSQQDRNINKVSLPQTKQGTRMLHFSNIQALGLHQTRSHEK